MILKYNYEQHLTITKEEIHNFLTTCYGEDEHTIEYHLRGFSSPNQVCAFTTKLEGHMVGSAFGWKMKFHPYCTYISIAAAPGHDIEMSDSLLHMIQASPAIEYPLQTTIWESSTNLCHTLEKHNFNIVRRTNITNLDLSKIPPIDEVIHTYNLTSYTNGIRSLQEIKPDEELKAQLIHLARETYENTHTINPLGVHDLAVWDKLVFGEDTILEASYVVINNGEVLAYALIHESEDSDQLELGWRGTKSISSVQLIQLLTSYQIHYAKQLGYKYVQAEIDDTDPYSMVMLDYFPFAPSPTLITYQLTER
ncbi:hypothetical protein E0485_02260 [Paenibacillus albiflavus]|uniref:Uncharacterized protein n=1 Tax=Paenibacillus albiflavus TaxID=2545760 RepID=A0A4R4ENT7_9BACL|nr:hypothetical protein [Paenibacillus albiflavus]TCZ81120.1 hypothetical protein E0485_02260 [Paenibacillus albiflavus]